jgi:serine/threonine-protein kinase
MPRRLLGGLVVAGIVLVLVVAGVLTRSARSATGEPIKILVKPFDFIGAEEDVYLGAGFAREIRDRLRRVAALNVFARETSERVDSAGWAELRIRGEIGADYILDGTVQQLPVTRGEGRLRVGAELVRASDGVIVDSWSSDSTISGLLVLHAGIAERAVDGLQIVLGRSERGLFTLEGTDNPAAYRAYQLGNFHMMQLNAEAAENALVQYQVAIDRDPTWARAHAGLAGAYMMLGGWWGNRPPGETESQAEAAALRALELDETLAEAHVVLADCRFKFRWDWPGADSAFRRGMELHPTFTIARAGHANYLGAMGRFDEAIASARLTLELDPLSPIAYNELGYALELAGRYDEALEQYREALALDPRFPQSRMILMQHFLRRGMLQAAIAESDFLHNSPGVAAWVAYAYGRSGRRTDALDILDQLTRRAETELVSPVYLAQIHMGLDQPEKALDLLEKGYRERAVLMGWLNQFWVFDPLRSDQRFQDLLRRMDFPERD